MKIFNSRTLAILLLSASLTACTVGDTSTGLPNNEGADAGAAGDPDAGEATLQWSPSTLDVPLLKAAMHYVSPTEIYAVVDNKICIWNGSAWADHTLPALGLSAAMHFVTPTQIYAVVGNTVQMWDGLAWVNPTAAMAGITDGLGNAEIHWVSDNEIYAVIINGLDRYISMYNGTAWVQMTEVAPDLAYSMHFVSPTEVYAVLGTKICKATLVLGVLAPFAIVSPDQANLRPGIQAVSDTEMYAVIGDKVCKWDGLAWADITTDMAGLHPEFLRTSDEDILALAGTAIVHWAPVAP